MSRSDASRYLDASRGLCALKIGGWAPHELHEHEAEEVARDQAEGVRLAYVAATRARDLLVVPGARRRAVGGRLVRPAEPRAVSADGVAARRRARAEVSGVQVEGLGAAAAERRAGRHRRRSAPGCTRSPAGLFRRLVGSARARRSDAKPPFGVRREDLIVKDVPKNVVADGRSRVRPLASRARRCARGRRGAVADRRDGARVGAAGDVRRPKSRVDADRVTVIVVDRGAAAATSAPGGVGVRRCSCTRCWRRRRSTPTRGDARRSRGGRGARARADRRGRGGGGGGGRARAGARPARRARARPPRAAPAAARRRSRCTLRRRHARRRRRRSRVRGGRRRGPSSTTRPIASSRRAARIATAGRWRSTRRRSRRRPASRRTAC